MSLRLDPEFEAAVQALPPAKPDPPIGDIATRRESVRTGLAQLLAQTPDPGDVEVEIFEIAGSSGPVKIYRFYLRADTAASKSAGEPAVLHLHGGGYIAMDVEMWAPYLKDQVSKSSIQIFSVDYKLAPESPFPGPLEEGYTALTWLQSNASQYNIDPARIAVQGESAGGGLAAALCLLARDRQVSPPIAKQILIYPMIDDRNLTRNELLEPFATWSNADNITAWTAYLGQKPGSSEISYLAAPARAPSLTGLPPTYLDVGELDIFRDENLAYASKIAAANISIEVHLYPGVPHAFELIVPTTTVATKAQANRLTALASY